MAKQKKALTSRKNSKQSTGPRTTQGKNVVKLNAVSHGVRSSAAIVSGERLEDWEAHRSGMIAAIAPANSLEQEFAERVAALTWRLRRVIRYEAAVSTLEDPSVETVPVGTGASRSIPQTRPREIVCKELDAARENVQSSSEMGERYRRLQAASDDQHYDGKEAFDILFNANAYTPHGDEYYFDVYDHEFLGEVGVPPDWRDKPQAYSGWTAGMVKKGIHAIAEDDDMDGGEALLDEAIRACKSYMEDDIAAVRRLEAELATLPPEPAMPGCGVSNGIVERIAFPNQIAIDKIMRYENHLSKQLFETLHTLERLQNQRARCELFDTAT